MSTVATDKRPAAAHAATPTVTPSIPASEDVPQPINLPAPAGVLTTLALAIPSFGLLPALLWPDSFRRYVNAERAQLRAIATSVARQLSHPDVPALMKDIDRMRVRRWLLVLTYVSAIAVIGVFVASLYEALHFREALFGSTYLLRAFGGDITTDDTRRTLFMGWVGCLGLAYGLQWLQVQLHAQDLRRLLEKYSTVVMDGGGAPVFMETLGAGFRPLWMLGAAAMLLVAAPWGVLMMLAGAVQRRYAKHCGPKAREAMAHQAADMREELERLAPAPRPRTTRPTATAAAPTPRRRVSYLCNYKNCAAPIAPGAKFCARCGRPTGIPLDQKA